MDTTLRQAGLLLLDAIPTVVMLLLLYAIYQNLVRKPLERMLAERREKTEGALQKARTDVAAAEARTPPVPPRTPRTKSANKAPVHRTPARLRASC